MLDSYRTILARPGALAFCLTGLVARLPISMLGLGIVLLVEGRSGSYGLAGSVSAVALVANAGCAIAQGRFIDRLGQGRVLRAVITVWGVALSLLIWSVDGDWPRWTTYALAALVGASMPSVGSCVRARWAHLLPAPAEKQTAFALEAAGDEAVFSTGPILVTTLAALVDPAAGLLAALASGVVGTFAFAAQRATEPPVHASGGHDGARPPLPWGVVAPLGLASLALGTLFGAAEVTTVAFSDEHGHQAWSGVLLAFWALGSLLAGIITGTVAWTRPVESRLRWGALAMTLTMVPLPWITSMPLMAGWLLLAGFSIAPTLIASMSLAEQAVPPARLTEGMAVLQTGLVAGVAPGATVAGVVIDAHGASASYVVSIAGGAVALLAALATRVRREA